MKKKPSKKKSPYKIREINKFKSTKKFKKPDAILDFEEIVENHFKNEENDMTFEQMPIIFWFNGNSYELFGL